MPFHGHRLDASIINIMRQKPKKKKPAENSRSTGNDHRTDEVDGPFTTASKSAIGVIPVTTRKKRDHPWRRLE
jgi:hypothetical protein